MASVLDQSVTHIPTIGDAMAKRLQRLGIRAVRDLLWHIPIRHEDYRTKTLIGHVQPGSHVTVVARITAIDTKRSFRRRLSYAEAVIEDETGSMKSVWFNQPYIAASLSVGTLVRLSGKVTRDRYGLHFANPAYERTDHQGVHTGRLVPVYPITRGVTQRQLRYYIHAARKAAGPIPDWLSSSFCTTHNVIPIGQAISGIHFPRSAAELERSRQRLSFDELFFIQLYSTEQKRFVRSVPAPAVPFDEQRVKAFIDTLPFTLTDPQRKAAWEILSDMHRNRPMNRLLEGDVGSGKTIVAAIAMLNTTTAKGQSAIMAPTEILAQQHFASLTTLFGRRGPRIALLTRALTEDSHGRTVTRSTVRKALADGVIDIVVGTHALLERGVAFHHLAFAVVDEQHRFGVSHRQALHTKMRDHGVFPHLLSMTATPIPRTLALTLYGDLDLSIIDALPKGRKPIITKVVHGTSKSAAYQIIADEIRAGRQAFVVVPLIERSERLDVKSVSEEYHRLSTEVFPQFRLGFLHGKLSAAKRESEMRAFLDGKTQILVSTSVIEVGIDVPNATVMLIENAERFGLAQLHQFRGRVGRSDRQSMCFLSSESESSTSLKRLAAMERSTNGFELAEMDLELRGSGDLYGVRQSGFPDLKIARLTDYPILTQAKKAARAIVAQDAWQKKYPALAGQLAQFRESIHWE